MIITRRFSSDDGPQLYFNRKHQQEAKDRGDYIDIHDISRNSADYDVLITDITHETLDTTIANEIGVTYLSKAEEADAKEVIEAASGYIFGMKRRPIVPFIVNYGKESRWAFFLLDSGSPGTYLSIQVSVEITKISYSSD